MCSQHRRGCRSCSRCSTKASPHYNNVWSDIWIPITRAQNTYHLLPSMATTPMGEQLSPRSMLALIGMPMEWQISATEGELEFWIESQQYCFSVVHWSDLNQIYSQRSVSKAIHTRKMGAGHTVREWQEHQQRKQQQRRMSWRTFLRLGEENGKKNKWVWVG